MSAIPSGLEKYIATRDKRQQDPVSAAPLRERFEELLSRKRIEVGGRSSCGGPVDPTWRMFTAWNGDREEGYFPRLRNRDHAGEAWEQVANDGRRLLVLERVRAARRGRRLTYPPNR